MEVTFRPNRSLALKATLLEARLFLRLPMKVYLVAFLATSGVILALDVVYTFTQGALSVWQWLAAVLILPFLVILSLAACYGHLRFARPITLKESGLYIVGGMEECGPNLRNA